MCLELVAIGSNVLEKKRSMWISLHGLRVPNVIFASGPAYSTHYSYKVRLFPSLEN